MDIQIPEDRFVVPQVVAADVGDAAKMFGQAISNPVDFPSIDQVVFEGDSVAFVFLDSLQNIENTISPLLDCLSDQLANATVNIVTNRRTSFSDDQVADWSGQFSNSGLNLHFETHDATQQSASALTAINKDGEPLYINRVVFDSDVVIPVGSWAGHQSDSIFPAFSTSDAMLRFKSGTLSASEQRAERKMVEESIGLYLVVEIASNPGGQITSVHCGEREAIRNEAIALDAGCQINQLAEAKLVVATIESQSPTWEHFFQALINASLSSVDNDRIVLWTSIDELPNTMERTILELQFESDQDVIASALSQIPEMYHCVPSILEDKSVYLKSELGENDVEAMGLGHIESDRQIQQIVDSAESGVFLRDAHLCKIIEVEKSK